MKTGGRLEDVKKSGLPQALAQRALIRKDLGHARLAVPAFFHTFQLKHARFYWLLLAEGHLNRRLFGDMPHRIWALPLPLPSG